MRRFLENIRVAFQSLSLNRLRSFLTMLGIIIGVGAVVAIMAVGAGAQSSILENIQSTGTNLLTISPGRERIGGPGGPGQGGERFTNASDQEEQIVAGELKLEDYKALKQEAKLITGIASVISRSSSVTYLGVNSQVSITASTEDYVELQNYEIDKGNFFSSSDVANSLNVAVIGQQVITDYFGRINPIGEIMKIDGQNFTVIGTLKSIGSNAMGMNQDNMIIIPVTTAQNRLYGVDTVDRIMAQVRDKDSIDQATEEVENILKQRHNILPGKPKDFEVGSQTQMLSAVSSMTDTFSITLSSIAAISLLVGGIGIMNIMFVSVTERTREIGIRKATGAKNRDILIQFLTESIVLSLTGGILGILFAVLISVILQRFMAFNTTFTALSIILALSFSTIIGLTFGVFPAMRAARLNPIDSLRYE